MPLSSFTGLPAIASGSDATPGLFNSRYSILSQNLDQLNANSSDLSSDFSSVRDVFVNTETFAGADLGARFNAAVSSLSVSGGGIIIPPGQYALTTEMSVDSATSQIAIWAYGAVVTTSGISSALKISNRNTLTPCTVFGLRINHEGNSTVSYGINVEAARNVQLYDCVVHADDVAAGYAAVRFGMGDFTDSGDGALWARLINPLIRISSGASLPIGVLIEGGSNACTILGGAISNCDEGIRITNISEDTVTSTIPNSTVVDGVAFEQCGWGVRIFSSTSADAVFSGLRCVSNRFESVSTIFSLETITRNPLTPPYFAHNYITSGSITTYFYNPNDLRVTTLDNVLTPAIGPMILSDTQLEIRNETGTNFPIKVVNAGGARGVHVRTADDASDIIAIVDDGASDSGVLVSLNTLKFRVAGSDSWLISESANREILPVVHNTYDIGSFISSVRSLFVGGLHVSGATITVGTSFTPATGTSSGTTGDIVWDSSYVYVCQSTDSWSRATLNVF